MRPNEGGPKLADLFCGAGGATWGYELAGFDVHGWDTVYQINYPYMEKFHHGDAFEADLGPFSVVHASPPCQRWSRITAIRGKRHPDYIAPMRQRLKAWGGLYVIENVPEAPLVDPVLVCGAALGLGAVCRDGVYRKLKRHRLFESNFPLKGTGCGCDGTPIAGIYGNGAGGQNARGYKTNSAEREALLEADWMTVREMAQAIPPAYTRFIGSQIMEVIG